MSKPRLTPEEKKLRKERIRNYKKRNKEERRTARRIGIVAILVALSLHDLIKRKN